MVKCPNCGAIVSDGKFCEKCGNPLEGAMQIENAVNNMCIDNNKTTNFDNFSNNSAGSLGGFFSNIKTGMNKAATDLMAIKSDFSNATIIYMVNKIPNVQEKKIIVNNEECLYYNKGNGYELHNETFTVTDNSFVCFYIKNNTLINNNINFSIKSKIMKLNDIDEINVIISYDICFKVIDIDTFFHKLVSNRQSTFRVIDINSMLSDELRNITINSLKQQIESDGNLDLRDTKGQLGKFSDNIKNSINDFVKQYGMRINNFGLCNVSTEMAEINKLLIANLYKE